MPHPFSGQTPWRRARVSVPVADPAAGADWSAQVPAGVLWRPVAVRATLITSADVADRLPVLAVDTGNGTFLSIPATAVQAASLAWLYSWPVHGNAYQVTTYAVAGIPELVLQAGWSLGVATDNLQAADQWSGITLHVVETQIRDGSVDVADIPELVVQIVGG